MELVSPFKDRQKFTLSLKFFYIFLENLLVKICPFLYSPFLFRNLDLQCHMQYWKVFYKLTLCHMLMNSNQQPPLPPQEHLSQFIGSLFGDMASLLPRSRFSLSPLTYLFKIYHLKCIDKVLSIYEQTAQKKVKMPMLILNYYIGQSTECQIARFWHCLSNGTLICKKLLARKKKLSHQHLEKTETKNTPSIQGRVNKEKLEMFLPVYPSTLDVQGRMLISLEIKWHFLLLSSL